ncbi:MAG: hypothetical protein P8Y58_12370 [Novosphingobium sp.]
MQMFDAEVRTGCLALLNEQMADSGMAVVAARIPDNCHAKNRRNR